MTACRHVRVNAPYQLDFADEELPPPADDELLLKARSSLISTGSELRRYRRYEGYTAFQYPVCDLGYSFTGEVVERGGQLQAVAPGTRVVAVKRHATHVLTRYQVDETRTAVPIPDGVSDDEATFAPLLRSTLNWTRLADIQLDDSVAVLGQGLVGALLLQAAKLHHPKRLLATDTYALRLDLARRLGADEAFDAAAVDPVRAVREATGGKGANVVIETVGGAFTQSFEQAIGMCASGGRIVLVGMHTKPLSIPAHTMHDKRLLGSSLGYDYRAEVMRLGLDLVARRRLDVASLLTHRFGAAQAAEAYALLDQHPDQALGVILDWTDPA